MHFTAYFPKTWCLPPQSFYEECDRRGICLWQDFMFGYYDHARGDTAFLENCRAEIEGTIRRLRNHPSVLLWCGGNEQYLWTPTATVSAAKREIFERLMPEACRRLDPTRLFHTSSPYGGSPTGNWPLEGDWHDYTTINFAPEASVPLFGSEVLRASVPSLTSMRRFMSEEELVAEGIRSRHPQARPAGLAAGLGLSLHGHRHLGPRRPGPRVLRSGDRRGTHPRASAPPTANTCATASSASGAACRTAAVMPGSATAAAGATSSGGSTIPGR